ncbi:hypothetical protein ALI22I_28655 [Saccharothrix sp. ALI-22-I]|uniref:hypothetical protein n=1 Tax=Saccharothrix sp. ALI-22-I TaxID=1933778 RepID=UPI00097C65C0|nr:hypothetical protein [Saccharothrix sp. ALI-22-I]ONI84527.1 hypothetical protein ALI22I_28655 [Saccharothrix sp. ALI-22-I]
MPFSSADLATELRTLRKGRGMQAPRIGDEVGPALRELCAITESDSHASIRDKVGNKLHTLSEKLPDDLRTIFRTTLALHGDTQGQFLNDRVKLLANKFTRDVRTIRRRMDEAFDLLAENAIATEPRGQRSSAGHDWYVQRFEAVLRLDRTTPECFERRTIVAEHDGLDRIRVSITLPLPTGTHGHGLPELHVEPYFGAELIGRQRHPGNRFVFELRLPVTLSAGESHEYGLVMRLPDGQGMRPHYVFFPERPCEAFDLRVRFPLTNTPAEVQLVPGVFHRAIDDPASSGGTVPVDAVHEVHVTFSNLMSGYGYGLRWAEYA